MSIPTKPILDLNIACATYESAYDEVVRLAAKPGPSAVSACNTHILAAARNDPQFARIMQCFELVLPDGTPLKWILNMSGARLADRVYGPYLMRYAIERSTPAQRHFFFGGSSACQDRLESAIRAMNPGFCLAGRCSPPFREWAEEDEEEFAEQINKADADFIWVALGGVRQETWIIKNRHRFRRGVFLAVGDAFELLAGKRPFAPDWVQRQGLTWLYRLSQEPARLWPRYFRYNSLFLMQILQNRIFPRRLPAPGSKLKIAFLGFRGTPARYAGFETVVEQLGWRLANNGHHITVYNRSNHYSEKPDNHLGMHVVYLPTIPTKSLETIVHSSLSGMHAGVRHFDVIYLCGVGNAFLANFLRLTGKRVVLNVDGIDYKRSKWNGFARWWLHRSEVWGLRFADAVIADNHAVVRHYEENYHFSPSHIAYGANLHSREKADKEVPVLERFGLRSRGFILFVSRLSPENEAHLLIEAYIRSGVELPLVLVGPSGYEERYLSRLKSLANDRILFTGGLYGTAYADLSRHALFFVLPSAIEATRLVLLDQMGFGAAILFRESDATREVIGNTGLSFGPDCPVQSLADRIRELVEDPERCTELGRLAYRRAEKDFGWDSVTRDYEALFNGLFPDATIKVEGKTDGRSQTP